MNYPIFYTNYVRLRGEVKVKRVHEAEAKTKANCYEAKAAVTPRRLNIQRFWRYISVQAQQFVFKMRQFL